MSEYVFDACCRRLTVGIEMHLTNQALGTQVRITTIGTHINALLFNKGLNPVGRHVVAVV